MPAIPIIQINEQEAAVILNDQSQWKVREKDRPLLAIWHQGQGVIVQKSELDQALFLLYNISMKPQKANIVFAEKMYG